MDGPDAERDAVGKNAESSQSPDSVYLDVVLSGVCYEADRSGVSTLGLCFSDSDECLSECPLLCYIGGRRTWSGRLYRCMVLFLCGVSAGFMGMPADIPSGIPLCHQTSPFTREKPQACCVGGTFGHLSPALLRTDF